MLNLWVFCVDELESHSKGLLHKICYWRPLLPVFHRTVKMSQHSDALTWTTRHSDVTLQSYIISSVPSFVTSW